MNFMTRSLLMASVFVSLNAFAEGPCTDVHQYLGEQKITLDVLKGTQKVGSITLNNYEYIDGVASLWDASYSWLKQDKEHVNADEQSAYLMAARVANELKCIFRVGPLDKEVPHFIQYDSEKKYLILEKGKVFGNMIFSKSK